MIVYVDGENVVHQIMDALKRAGREGLREEMLKVDMAGLIRLLVRKKDVQIKYYATTLQLVKTDPDLEQRSRDMITWTGKWVNHLAAQGIEVVKAGKLMAREGIACPNCGFKQTVFREKGVDVRLAVDLVVDSATEKLLVVWSSDADLLPAIQVAKDAGARVKNLAHEDALNWALARQCGEWQTYSDAELIKLVKKAERITPADQSEAPAGSSTVLDVIEEEKANHGDQA